MRQGFIYLYSEKEKKFKNRHIYLFDDLMIVTKALTNGRHWLKIFITFNQNMTIDLNDNMIQYHGNEYKMVKGNRKIILAGLSTEEGKSWFNTIKEQLSKLDKNNFSGSRTSMMLIKNLNYGKTKFDKPLKIEDQVQSFHWKSYRFSQLKLTNETNGFTLNNTNFFALKQQVKMIAAGSEHSLLIDIFNRVYSWGNSERGQTGLESSHTCKYPMMIPALKNEQFKQICAKGDQSAALSLNGQVYLWGDILPGKKIQFIKICFIIIIQFISKNVIIKKKFLLIFL